MKTTISYASSTLRFLMISIIISLTTVRTTAHVYEFRRIAAGADSAEIYITSYWYDPHPGGPYGGLFRSTNHGQTLSVQYKDTWLGGILYADMYGDLLPGTLYGESGLSVSHDYGLTWEFNTNPVTYNVTGGGGSVSGEIYLAGDDSAYSGVLYHCTHFGDSVYLMNTPFDSMSCIEAGSLPGELFALKYPYYGSNNQDTLGLAFSHDYGQTFIVNYLDTPIVKDLHQYTLTHGPDTGELYLTGRKASDNQYHILHSMDYGHTFSLQYITPVFYPEWDFFSFVAGREPGSFYILQSYYDITLPLHNCLEIHYSSDYGVTYTTFFHELDSTFTGLPREISLPELKVYPNPAKDQVTFQFNEEVRNAETHLCVFDLEGKLMDEKLIEPGAREIILDTRRYAPGIYCYMLNQATPGAQGKFVIVR